MQPVIPSAETSRLVADQDSPRRGRRRRWLSFSLRGVLLLFVVCSVPLAIVSHLASRARTQKAAVRALLEAGGTVWYDYEERDKDGNKIEPAELPGPTWLREWLGIDYVAGVRGVSFASQPHDRLEASLFERLRELTDIEELNLGNTSLTNANLRRLAGLLRLKVLDVSSTDIDDAGIEALAGMQELECLELNNTLVAGPGLAVLENCPALRKLGLNRCGLTDDAFDHLSAIQSLRELDLTATPTNDRHLGRLGALTGLCSLAIGGTNVTDSGLVALGSLRNLESLFLGFTAVTGSGMKALQECKSLRELSCRDAAVDDAGLVAIADLPTIETLRLGENAITIAGLARLVKLPRLSRLDLDQRNDGNGLHLREEARQKLRALALREADLAGASDAERVDFSKRLDYIDRSLEGAELMNPGTIRTIERIAAQVRGSSPESALAVAQLLDQERWVSAHFSACMHINHIYADAAARSDHPADVFLAWQDSRSIIAATEEHRQVMSARVQGSAHHDLLKAIMARGIPVLSCAAAAVALDPCPASWEALFSHHQLRGPLHALAMAAWRDSDPKNRAAWYCNWSTPEFWDSLVGSQSSRPLSLQFVPLISVIEARHARRELRLRPQAPWLDDDLFARASRILADAGFNVDPRKESVKASDPWSWRPPTAGTWSGQVLMLCAIADDFYKNGHEAEAERFRAAGHAMTREFLLAPPRELGTVLTGCDMATSLSYAKNTNLEAERGKARKAALDALTKRIRQIVEDPARQPPLDEATVAAWMRGLLDCDDETARRINQALDEWDQLDQRLMTATKEELESRQEPAP